MLLCFSDGPRERVRGVPADLSRERDGETRLERDGVDAMDLTPAATRCVVCVCVCVCACECVCVRARNAQTQKEIEREMQVRRVCRCTQALGVCAGGQNDQLLDT